MPEETRLEFGVPRDSCDCETCKDNCRHMPGFLIPADLERIRDSVAPGAYIYAWAEKNLRASPGAIVAKGGCVFRVPTLVPAVNKDSGACRFLGPGDLCMIHPVAPFGCAFFSCSSGPDSYALSSKGITEVYKSHEDGALYHQVWTHLNSKGLKQKGPETLRRLMASEGGK